MDTRDNHPTLSSAVPTSTRRVKLWQAAILVIAPLALSACGTAVGAAGGGLVGNQFGHGSGKTAATAGGVVAGGIIGHEVTGD